MGTKLVGDHLSRWTKFWGTICPGGPNLMGTVCLGGQEVGNGKSGDQMGSGRNALQPNFDIFFLFLQIGPNVSIGQNVQVAAGARIKESIVLNNSNIGANSLVLYAVIGDY